MQSGAELITEPAPPRHWASPSLQCTLTVELDQCQPCTPFHQLTLQHSQGSRKDAPKDAAQPEQPTDISERASIGVCTPEREQEGFCCWFFFLNSLSATPKFLSKF